MASSASRVGSEEPPVQHSHLSTPQAARGKRGEMSPSGVQDEQVDAQNDQASNSTVLGGSRCDSITLEVRMLSGAVLQTLSIEPEATGAAVKDLILPPPGLRLQGLSCSSGQLLQDRLQIKDQGLSPETPVLAATFAKDDACGVWTLRSLADNHRRARGCRFCGLYLESRFTFLSNGTVQLCGSMIGGVCHQCAQQRGRIPDESTQNVTGVWARVCDQVVIKCVYDQEFFAVWTLANSLFLGEEMQKDRDLSQEEEEELQGNMHDGRLAEARALDTAQRTPFMVDWMEFFF